MIGYYVHHHGLGHRTRALEIARELDSPVAGFSSLEAPEGWPGTWHRLPMDVPETAVDPTANGVLHWAPLDHTGHKQRLGIIAEHLASDLTTMVTDTSAEVTLLARIFGVRTVVMAMRGDRTDRTHRAAYDAASLIVAPWTEETAEAYWPREWTAKTVHSGAISRFDRVARNAATADVAPEVPRGVVGGTEGKRRVLVVWGRGGTEVTAEDIGRARAATPEWGWTVRSPDNPSPDLWAELRGADVVVSHAGNNAVAELSAAGRPAVVIAQSRPFDEQFATARALQDAGICMGLTSWPSSEQWPGLLERAAAQGGSGWARWRHGDGAHRAAAAIERLDAEAAPCA